MKRFGIVNLDAIHRMQEPYFDLDINGRPTKINLEYVSYGRANAFQTNVSGLRVDKRVEVFNDYRKFYNKFIDMYQLDKKHHLTIIEE